LGKDNFWNATDFLSYLLIDLLFLWSENVDQLALMDCWSLILHSGEKNGSSFGLFS
jgi:hypothetical protein